MARRTKKRLGKDAKVSVLSRYLHPSRLISSTLPNKETNHRLEDCIVVRMVVKKVNRRDQLVVVMKHDSFKTHDGAYEDIYTVPRWCKVMEEGPSEAYFHVDNGQAILQEALEENTADDDVELPAIIAQIDHRGFRDGDLLQMDGQVEVDDDNLPAPENVLIVDDANVDDVFVEWGHDGVCQCWQVGGQNALASLFNFGGHSGVPSILQIFEILFPNEFLEQVVIGETNKKLDKKLTR